MILENTGKGVSHVSSMTDRLLNGRIFLRLLNALIICAIAQLAEAVLRPCIAIALIMLLHVSCFNVLSCISLR